jgi:CRP-like cAMP-binding protein
MASMHLVANVLRNRAGGELSAEQRGVLAAAISETQRLAPGQISVQQGQPLDFSTLLVEGMMTRHIDAPDGRRHLVAIHFPGDFVDLHGYALKRLDHDVSALTEAEIAIVPHAAIERIQATHLHLTKRLWFQTLLDAAIHRQWVYRLGSLSALERVAHFLCETNARLLAIGVSDGQAVTLPMTQNDIGEVCSLTNVHVSRVLRQLREQGLCTLRSFQLEIHDLQALAAIGRFQPDYLYLNPVTAARAVGRSTETA